MLTDIQIEQQNRLKLKYIKIINNLYINHDYNTYSRCLCYKIVSASYCLCCDVGGNVPQGCRIGMGAILKQLSWELSRAFYCFERILLNIKVHILAWFVSYQTLLYLIRFRVLHCQRSGPIQSARDWLLAKTSSDCSSSKPNFLI